MFILCFTSAAHGIAMIYNRIKWFPKKPTLLHKIRVVQLLMQTKFTQALFRTNTEKVAFG